ncbi:MAG: PEGA domain-containing protein [Thermodesulfobacteriota bacterium]
MKKFILLLLLLALVGGCGYPKETLRGVGHEGFLFIVANPDDAEVFIDGERMGLAADFERDPIELRSGTHKVEIRKPGYLADVRDVFVGNQSRHTLKVNLKKEQ